MSISANKPTEVRDIKIGHFGYIETKDEYCIELEVIPLSGDSRYYFCSEKLASTLYRDIRRALSDIERDRHQRRSS